MPNDEMTPYDWMTDEDLVVLGQAGNEEAVSVLINRYRNLVRARARSYFLAGGDREDILQEGMIGLFKSIRDFSSQTGSEFKTFANVCVVRQILTAVKSASRFKHAPLNSSMSLDKPIYEGTEESRTLSEVFNGDVDIDPETIFLRKELLTVVRENVFQHLSDLELRVLAAYLRGESYRDIAARIQRPVKSVDNAVQRIKRKIEVYLDDYMNER